MTHSNPSYHDRRCPGHPHGLDTSLSCARVPSEVTLSYICMMPGRSKTKQHQTQSKSDDGSGMSKFLISLNSKGPDKPGERYQKTIAY